MRHKPRKFRRDHNDTRTANQSTHESDELSERELGSVTKTSPMELQSTERCENNTAWKVISHADVVVGPTFMGLLSQSQE